MAPGSTVPMSNQHLDTTTQRVPAADSAATGAALLGLLAAGGPLRGPALAQRRGVSRAAVWKQVEVLRAAGLDIAADGRGYHLAQPLEWLDPVALRARLPRVPARRVGTIESHWQLDSTSSEIARRVADLPDRSFVFADWQRAGRGRRGRAWVSPPATNLQVSCLKRFASGYAALAGLSLVAGVAVLQALADCGVAGVDLKWPNDLQAGDAKLGGVLVELGGEFMGPCHAIIGIGLNLRMPSALAGALDRDVTDLATICGGTPPGRMALAVALLARLVDALDAFAEDGFAPFRSAWQRHDLLRGRRLRVAAARGQFEGVGEGVDERGALKVRCADGLRVVDSAEVTVRPQ